MKDCRCYLLRTDHQCQHGMDLKSLGNILQMHSTITLWTLAITWLNKSPSHLQILSDLISIIITLVPKCRFLGVWPDEHVSWSDTNNNIYSNIIYRY